MLKSTVFANTVLLKGSKNEAFDRLLRALCFQNTVFFMGGPKLVRARGGQEVQLDSLSRDSPLTLST